MNIEYINNLIDYAYEHYQRNRVKYHDYKLEYISAILFNKEDFFAIQDELINQQFKKCINLIMDKTGYSKIYLLYYEFLEYPITKTRYIKSLFL